MPALNKAIKRIEVKKLFGTYNYSIVAPSNESNSDRLMILYGDNGSGKTTILRTLFHLLAPERSEGHKTAVGKVPFSRFEIDFTSGDHVWAHRPDGKLTGSFTMGFRQHRKKEITFEFKSDSEGTVKASPEAEEFLTKLQCLNIGLYFLSDDRTVHLAGREKQEYIFSRQDFMDEEQIYFQDIPSQIIRLGQQIKPDKRNPNLLMESIKRAELWIQSQAVRSAAEGESSVNSLYGEIIKRISSLPLEKNPSLSYAVGTIESRVDKLESRSKQYSQYGLIPEFNGRDILSIVKSAPQTHIGIITNVITPYIESVEKKLDAMARLQRQIDSLVSIVNSFFSRKKFSFKIHDGFKIETLEGKDLLLSMLSSGERHLLLLFCNTLLAFGRPSIFIIDEPEISLNIKWQRMLISSLLDCAGDNSIQYLFATHSFELLAQYKDNTIKLLETAE